MGGGGWGGSEHTEKETRMGLSAWPRAKCTGVVAGVKAPGCTPLALGRWPGGLLVTRPAHMTLSFLFNVLLRGREKERDRNTNDERILSGCLLHASL